MRPTDEEIRRAAYARWERRGWSHGGDRDDWFAARADLTFRASYGTTVDHTMDGTGPRVIGESPARRCRFCERKAGPNGLGAPRPIFAGHPAPLSAEVCADCRSDWGDGLDDAFRELWTRLVLGEVGRSTFHVAAFKAMAAGGLLMMPASDLRYYVDALEWVSNPDHDSDDRLIEGAAFRVYRASFLGRTPRLSLMRRLDDEATVPYMLLFIEADGIMVQAPMPMCLRDEDLDGQAVEHTERILADGYGHDYREAASELFPLAVSTRRTRRNAWMPAVA